MIDPHLVLVELSRHSKPKLMVVLLPCLWVTFLSQLPTILFLPPLHQIKETTLSENWHVFFYCSLQKVMMSSSLPLVEQREDYVLPNHSRFPAVDENDFLSGTRVMAALDKIRSQFLRKEFHCDVSWRTFSKSLWIVYCQPLFRDQQ